MIRGYALRKKTDTAHSQIAEEIRKAYYDDYQSKSPSPFVSHLTQQMGRLSQQSETVLVLDRMDFIASKEDEVCYAISDTLEKHFYDYGHHTLAGARYFAREIEKMDWLGPVLQIYDRKFPKSALQGKALPTLEEPN